MIADVTGGAGVYGTPQKNAYELANDDIKSGKIDAGGANLAFDVQDAASDGAQVVNLMQKFTTDGSTPIVLGPTLSGEAFRAFPIAEARELPGDGHVDDRRRRDRDRSDGLPRLARRIASDPDDRASAPTTSGTTRPPRSSTATTTRSPRPTATCSARARRAGVDVVDTETFHIKDTDFQAALTRIDSKKPDVHRDRRALPRGDEDHRAGRQARHQGAHDRRQRPQLDPDVQRRRTGRAGRRSSARRGSRARSTPATSSS